MEARRLQAAVASEEEGQGGAGVFRNWWLGTNSQRGLRVHSLVLHQGRQYANHFLIQQQTL